MNKIKAKCGISYSEGVATFDLSDVNCETEQEWNELSETEKEERLQQAIDVLPESPSMILEKYEVMDTPDVRRSFSMSTVLDFGKHKGKTIKQLFDMYEDTYLMWIYENFDAAFSKDIEQELEWRLAESKDIARSYMWG